MLRTFTAIVCVSLLPAIAGCMAKTLDGGSTGDTSGAGTGGNGQGTASASNGEIADTPVSGRIAGKPFEAKTIDVTFSKRQNQWFLSLDNYVNDCGSTGSSPTDGEDALSVNIGGLEPKAGTFTIAYADGHGAALQAGIYPAESTKKADIRAVQNGTLRLDTWTETPGATITGALKLFADEESEIEGTFTATVCAPR